MTKPLILTSGICLLGASNVCANSGDKLVNRHSSFLLVGIVSSWRYADAWVRISWSWGFAGGVSGMNWVRVAVMLDTETNKEENNLWRKGSVGVGLCFRYR